jgi:hypothetical protein
VWTITIEGEADTIMYGLLNVIEGYNVDVTVNQVPLGTVRVVGTTGRMLVCERTDNEYYEPTGERVEIDLTELDAIHVP